MGWCRSKRYGVWELPEFHNSQAQGTYELLLCEGIIREPKGQNAINWRIRLSACNVKAAVI